MYRKALVGGEWLYFVHAPPQTDLDTNPEARRPKAPNPGESRLRASVYYYWWAFLRLNEEYIDCCNRGGVGKMSKLYKSFGDIRDGRRKSTDPKSRNGHVDEFREWWIERGAQLFAEPQTKEHINVLKDVSQGHDASGRVLLSIPLSGNVEVTLHAIGRLLRPMFGEFQRQNGHYSRAKYKPEDSYRLSSLYEALKIAEALVRARKKGGSFKQWSLADDAEIPIGADPGSAIDIEAVKGKIVTRALKNANRLIANVGEGRFPDFSDPSPGSFCFFEPKVRRRRNAAEK